MLKKSLKYCIGLAFVSSTTAAFSDESSVKTLFEATTSMPVQSVSKSPLPGLYEVFSAGQIFYTDESVTTLIVGSMIDAKTKNSITAERLSKLTSVNFSELPLANAIKTVQGKGTRVMATFEDPNCGYCKQVATELAKVKDVTIYTFLYPILSEQSVDLSKQVWCSGDKAKAWRELMIQGKKPAGKGDCTAPIQANLDLGRKLSVSGTPTIVFANGSRIPGAVNADKIEEMLSQK